MKATQRAVAIIVALTMLLVATSASAQMSEGEKKAAARAAYMEGVKLQDDGKPVEALSRFEAAQKLYDAPTHLLHIAECQALTGKLVEASETYETLTRKTLPPSSPDVFVQAQDQAKAELPPLRARIPTMKVNVTPDPRSLRGLQINVNDRTMPVELVGIARPVNPGQYRLSAQAQGYATQNAQSIDLKEKEQKVVDLALVPVAVAPAYPIVVTPGPPPYNPQQPYTPPPPPYEQRPPPPAIVPSQMGLLFGAHVGYFAPGGNVAEARSWENFTGSGPGVGADLAARLARMLLLGGQLEFVSFSEPKSYAEENALRALNQQQRTLTATSFYGGVYIGILPNVDKVSFWGDIGLGYRSVSRKLDAGSFLRDETLGGAEGSLGLGFSIPAGPIRVVPKFSLAVGSMSQKSCTDRSNGAACASVDPSSVTNAFGIGSGTVTRSSTHTLVSIQLAIYYHLDFGKKTAPAPATAPGNQPIQ